jgi:hypothetical protein
MSSLLVFNIVYRLKILSVIPFRPSFVNYCPSNLLSGSPPPPLPPSKSQSTVYTDSVWLGGDGVSSVGDHILQELNNLFLTRFRTYKIAPKLLDHPKQKPRRGGGLGHR